MTLSDAKKSAKFRPIKTVQITCKECGHKGMMEIDEKIANTSVVNFVQKIRLSARNEALASIKKVVDEQAEDEGLWSVPFDSLQPIMEAYLQQELRRLHAVIEETIKSFRVSGFDSQRPPQGPNTFGGSGVEGHARTRRYGTGRVDPAQGKYRVRVTKAKAGYSGFSGLAGI